MTLNVMSLHDLTKSQASLLERSVPLLFEVVGKVCSCFNVRGESRGGFLFLMYFSMLDMCSLLRIIFVRSSVSFSSSSFVRVLGSLGSWVRLGWGVCCGVWGSSLFCPGLFVVCGISSMGVSCSSSPFRSCSSCSSVMSWFSLFWVSGSVVVNSFSGICSRRESGTVERGGESV